MSDGSPIEWLDRPGTKPASWNPIVAYRDVEMPDGTTKRLRGWHCEHVHDGCEFCYAEGFNERLGTRLPYKPGHRKDISIELHEATLLQPLKWREPRTVFVCSMTDLYGPWVKDEWLDKIKAVQALTPQHTYIELTKRPERMREYASAIAVREDAIWRAQFEVKPAAGHKIFYYPLPNVWGLVSCSTQEDADKFIPILLNTPLAIRGVSAEPLLGPIDLRPWLSEDDGCEGCDDGAMGAANRCSRTDIPRDEQCPRNFAVVQCYDVPPISAEGQPAFVDCERVTLDWIIVGGESGRNARPMHPDWARSIKAQCEAAGVPLFFKQFGEWAPSSQQEWERDDGFHTHSLIVPDGRFGDTVADLLTKPLGTAWVRRLGKKAAGRLLDGAEHNGFPQARTT